MEPSELRRHLREMLERAKHAGTERRGRADEANREFPVFLDTIAIPLFKQTAGILKSENVFFTVFTPGGSVRLASDRNPQDYIEIVLDTTGEHPAVVGHTSRARGRRIIEQEHTVAEGPVRDIDEEQVLVFLKNALEPFLER